jgi:histidinol-phosphate phosphatase family protein
VEIDRDGRITRFLPKPRQPGLYCRNLVNAAFYVLSPEVFLHIDKGARSDFGKNVFPAMLERGETLYGYVTAEYLKDMGTVDRLRQVNEDFASGRITRWNKSNSRPAVFLDRDGTINREVGLISREEDLELIPGAAKGVRLLNKSDYLSVVVTNQSVIARGLCGFEDLERIHAKMDTLLGNEGAYLDSIFYCPHHPDKGFPGEQAEYKVDCTCRKPATGLIETAIRRLNIDLSASFLIGDSTRDVETGRRLGILTVLVRTGYGGKDNRYPAEPDFIFDDLEEAAVFITEELPGYQEVFRTIAHRFQSRKTDEPFIVLIGGLARSGKSTFARALSFYLRKSGIAHVVHRLDHWILGADERTSEMSVRDRFQYQRMTPALESLIRLGKMEHPVYDPMTRTVIGTRELAWNPSQVLILEGVAALDIPEPAENSIKVFCDVDTHIRHRRLLAFYREKGLDAAATESLIAKREQDETPYILPGREKANYVVMSQARAHCQRGAPV